MELLKGGPVSSAIGKEIKECLKGREGRQPVLAVIRVGEREDDLSYERSILKKAGQAGVNVSVTEIAAPEGDGSACLSMLRNAVLAANRDPEVDGILLFRPLPALSWRWPALLPACARGHG